MLTAAQVFSKSGRRSGLEDKTELVHQVAKADRIINPDLERMYAKRAGSKTVEVDGASHSVYQSRPAEVAAMIEDAAGNSGGK